MGELLGKVLNGLLVTVVVTLVCLRMLTLVVVDVVKGTAGYALAIWAVSITVACLFHASLYYIGT